MARSVVDFPDWVVQTCSHIADPGQTGLDFGTIFGNMLAASGGQGKALSASRSRFTPAFWNTGTVLAGLIGTSPTDPPSSWTAFFQEGTIPYGKANTLFRLPKALIYDAPASGAGNWSSSTAWDVSAAVASLASALAAKNVLVAVNGGAGLRGWSYPDPSTSPHTQWGGGFLTECLPCNSGGYFEVNDGVHFPRYSNPVVESGNWFGGDLLILSPALRGVYMTGLDPTTWTVFTSQMNADVTQLTGAFPRFRKFQHSVWYVAGDGQTGAAATAADSRWTTLASSTGALGGDYRNFNNGSGFTADVVSVIKTFFGIP